MRHRLIALATLAVLAGSWARAGDWPQFRGPDRSGVSKDTGLLKSWPKEGPKLLWTFKNAGLGFSSFAVVGDTLYTLGTRGEDEIVLAIDVSKGTELWTAKIGPIFTFKENDYGDGPRSTPTIDGDRLYALGAQGELVCLDLTAKEKEVWRKNLIKDFGGQLMIAPSGPWGYSESPLVDGDLLVCTPGGDKGTLLALDKKTGKTIWQSGEFKNQAPYSSMVVADIRGVRQYIQTSYVGELEGGVVSAFRAMDGKVLWNMPIFKGSSYAICPTPIIKGNQVYVTSGYGGGCHLFEIGKDFKAKDLFSKSKQKTVKNTHGGVVAIGDHIFGHSEGLGWVCQEWNKGEIVWSERNKFECRSGAITAAEGRLYLYTDEGEVALVEANPAEFKEVSSFTIPEKSKIPQTRPTSRASKIWAHPVIANGRLYLRDHEFIFCYDLKK